MTPQKPKSGEAVDLRLRISPTLNDALRAQARLLRRPYTHLVRDAISVYLADTRPIPPLPAAVAVSGDIARLLQVTVYTTNLVREVGRRLDRRDMAQPDDPMALLQRLNLRADLESAEVALCASRRQLALHLGELPTPKRIPRTCNRADTVETPSMEAIP